jgi:hypothetical protein
MIPRYAERAGYTGMQTAPVESCFPFPQTGNHGGLTFRARRKGSTRALSVASFLGMPSAPQQGN